MEKKENIVRYSADDLSRMTSQTDWAKVDATTQEEIESQAEADHGPLPDGWENTVMLGIPGPKRGGATGTLVKIGTIFDESRRPTTLYRS